MSEITFDVGLAYKIKQALSRNGIPDVADLDWLATGNNLANMRLVRLGHAKIITLEHIIDCDADPFIPDGWSVLPDDEQLLNRVRGAFKWNAEGVALHLDKHQKNGKRIEGNKLRKELADKHVLNANVLDYLLANPHLIPAGWKDEFVFFWGTIYRSRVGSLYVRCLVWYGGRWSWDADWLDDGWSESRPAAVSAS